MNPDLLTAKEVQAILRVGRNAIYELAAKRRIEHVRIGQKVFFPRAAVEEFIRANTVSPKRDFFSAKRHGFKNRQPDEFHSSAPSPTR